MTTAENQVATAVYYETDKSFPSSAVPAGSSPEDQFKTIASKISIDPESTEQSDGLDSEDEVSFSLKILFQGDPSSYNHNQCASRLHVRSYSCYQAHPVSL